MSLKKHWPWLLLAGMLLLGALFNNELLYLWHTALFHIQQMQNSLRRSLTQGLSALRHHADLSAWWGMISLGFSYGILHAIGPGHGKAVVSTFILTQPSNYKSALSLAVGGALLQGISAIIWIGATLGLMQWLIRESVGQVIWAERFSYVLIIAVGVYIVWRQWRRLRQPAGEHVCGCGHQHSHNSSDKHHDDHKPSAQRSSRRAHLLSMLAIGARPCSGAILTLAVAAGWGLWGLGIAMTLAMSMGTAITVLSLALLTLYGRQRFVLRLSQGSQHWQSAFHILVVIGGIGLIVLGIMMLAASQGSNNLMFV